MKTWYEYTPVDTLFLRGSEPLLPGTQYETTRIFPPPATVISGAVRTAVLGQKKISIADYKTGRSGIEDLIGSFGNDAPFDITAVLLEKNGEIFIPAPFSWMSEDLDNGAGEEVKVTVAKPIDSETLNNTGMKSSAKTIVWAQHKKNLKTLGGGWVSYTAFTQKKRFLKKNEEYYNSWTGFVSLEDRTGIALTARRAVKEGQLFTGKHLRLHENVKIVWAVDRQCGLDDAGIISIGGEKRFGRYAKRETALVFPDSGGTYMSLLPIKCNTTNTNTLLASGKIHYRGGWNFSKKFHRDMTGYYPAGTVFTKKINHCCIAL